MGHSPSRNDEAAIDARLQAQVCALQLPVGDDSFRATLVAPARALPAAVFVPGWNGTHESDLGHLRDAAGLGCAVLAVDLRGHEPDDPRHKRVTREDNLRDLLAAFDWLVAREDIDPRAVAAIGFSYGGYLAAILASLRRVQWLVLRSPALYPDEGWNVPKHDLDAHVAVDAYRKRVQDPGSDRALAACATFEGDVLLVGAEHDEVLPPQVQESYAAAFGRARSITTRTLAGADHELSRPSFQRDWSALLEGWLREMVGDARKGAAMEQLQRNGGTDEADAS